MVNFIMGILIGIVITMLGYYFTVGKALSEDRNV